MSNFIYRLKKLNEYNGLAEIRQPECEACIRNNQIMEIQYRPEGSTVNQVMKLSPEQLISKRIGEPFWMKPENTPSKTGYFLWGYIWDTEEDNYE